jgi:hypothetical protein
LENFFWIFVDVPSQHRENPGHIAVVILRKEKVMISIVSEYGKNGQYSIKRDTGICGVAVLAQYCKDNIPPDMSGLHQTTAAAVNVGLYNLHDGEKFVIMEGGDSVEFDVKIDQAVAITEFQGLQVSRCTISGMAEAIAGLFHLRRELGWQGGAE